MIHNCIALHGVNCVYYFVMTWFKVL